MRANVSKRGITTTATEDNTAQSVNSTPQTSILVSEDVKLAPTRAINLPSSKKLDTKAQEDLKGIQAITLT